MVGPIGRLDFGMPLVLFLVIVFCCVALVVDTLSFPFFPWCYGSYRLHVCTVIHIIVQ